MKFKKIMMLGLIFVSGISLASCKSNEQTSMLNNTNTDEKEVVTVKTNSTNVYSSTADLISDVKTSVVDIYSYSSTATSAGSGVICGESDLYYYIITNHHVIDSATSFDVYVYDESGEHTVYEAELMGGSPKSDIAVLSIEKTGVELNVASFVEDSDTVRVGEEVVAIGNPLGIYGGSVTKGIISALKREVYLSDIGYMTLMQTDAAINSGNSGGALFNYAGLLVGIVNSGYSSYEGLNFAIPANDAKNAFTSIINTYSENGNSLGYVVGEQDLGLNVETATIYSSSSMKEQQTVIYVQSVDSGSDAYKASLKSYQSFVNGKTDSFYAIKTVDGNKFTSTTDLLKYLQSLNANDTVSFVFEEVTYYRSNYPFGQSVFYLSGNTVTVNITLSQYVYTI